jgi:hypothetical protein
MALKWATDAPIEAWLKRLGAAWTVKTHTLDELDIAGSRKNNARLAEKFREDIALEYGIAQLAGDAFPRPVTADPASGFRLDIILSGNHRIGGVEMLVTQGDLSAKDALIESYHIKTQDEMLRELIVRASNRYMGMRQGRDEAIEQARFMIDRYKMTVAQAAEHFLLKADWLTTNIRARHIQETLEREQVAAETLGLGVLQKLGQLEFNTGLLRKAGHLAARFRMTRNQITDLVNEVKTAAKNSESDAVQVLKEWEARLKDQKPEVMQGPRAVRRPYRSSFQGHLTTLLRFLERGNKGAAFTNFQELQITEKADRAEFRKRCRTVEVCLATLRRNSEEPPPKHKKRSKA